MKKGAVFSLLVMLIASVSFIKSQNINTCAGTGLAPWNGDNISAATANIGPAVGVFIDASNNIYITTQDRVRRISPSGTITTVAGSGSAGFSGDGGPATSGLLNAPSGVFVDPSGSIYIADYGNNRVRKVTSGTITTIAGGGTGGDGIAATTASLNGPSDVTVDAAGNVYIAENLGRRVRKVDLSGIITTYAGTGASGNSGDGGAATAATFFSPKSIALDPSGNLYICDMGNNRIRYVSTSGTITAFSGNPLGNIGFTGDGGQAAFAEFYYPQRICYKNGSLYISDTQNQRIRKIAPSGIITTIAGTGISGFSGDGGLATLAQIAGPQGLAVDVNGNVCICDPGNMRMRLIGCNQPTLSVTSTASTLCVGQSCTLTANGATSYTWNPGAMTGSAVVVSPTVTTTYTLSGTYYACTSSTVSTQNVSMCSGIKDLLNDKAVVRAYPNPFSDVITVEVDYDVKSIEVYDMNGRLLLKEKTYNQDKALINTEQLSSGVYVLIATGTVTRTARIVK